MNPTVKRTPEEWEEDLTNAKRFIALLLAACNGRIDVPKHILDHAVLDGMSVNFWYENIRGELQVTLTDRPERIMQA